MTVEKLEQALNKLHNKDSDAVMDLVHLDEKENLIEDTNVFVDPAGKNDVNKMMNIKLYLMSILYYYYYFSL